MATSKTEVEAASENARVKMALSLICRYDNTALLACGTVKYSRFIYDIWYNIKDR